MELTKEYIVKKQQEFMALSDQYTLQAAKCQGATEAIAALIAELDKPEEKPEEKVSPPN